MSEVSFGRPHPEYVEGYVKPKRTLFDPRPVQDRQSYIDWNKLAAASGGSASVLCFKTPISDHEYSGSFSANIKPKPMTMLSIIAKLESEAQVKDALQENRTLDHISCIEKLTKGQSENSEWFDYRKGVITASISHNVLTKVRNPARSSGDNLVARVLGYNRQVKTAAMSWGIEKEKYARKRYVKEIKKQHKCFSCEESGLILHSECYMLGASVDGRVTCDCCGVGNLEIKCPFTHRDKNIQQYVNQRNSCLAQSTDTVDVDYILKQNHHYYTQVQHQEKVQHELNQLTILSLPPPVTTSTVSGLKRKSSVAGPQLKKK